jgi:hypothetical protein
MALTDHIAVYTDITLFISDNGPGRASYWKLNSSILKHELVQMEINNVITHFRNNAMNNNSYSNNWELFKVGKYARKHESFVVKTRRTEEESVITKITCLVQKPVESLSEEDKSVLFDLQHQIDDMYKLKADGTFVRCRKKWRRMNKIKSFFFRLEKYHSKNNTIQHLNMTCLITDDPTLISIFSCIFYSIVRCPHLLQYCEVSSSSTVL